MKVEAYCDGACAQNTDRIGGYAAVIIYEGKRKEIVGSAIKTTNNQMELMAVITAFRAINRMFNNIACDVTVTADSEYVIKGATAWLPKWKKAGWKTAAKKPVKNKDLWMELSNLIGQHKVKFEWTRGHADCKWNNRCDELATGAVKTRREKESS